MNIRPIQSQSFKGYDACPIKRLYMQGVETKNQIDLLQETKEICDMEDIEFRLFNNPGFSNKYEQDCRTYHRWAQDDKTFIKNKGETRLLIVPTAHVLEEEALKNFAKGLGLREEHNETFLVGGNTFIGKKPDGEKWILIGKNEIDTNVLRKVCREYDVKFQNIAIISQPHFHLDMALRPIGYPFILVNDEEISKKNAYEYSRKLGRETKKFYKNHFKPDSDSEPYSKCDKVASELERKGFIPIRIGGVYTSGINYMNAIVNKHPDGTISYITNSARNSQFPNLDDIFERELKEKVPNIKHVYFVSGKRSQKNPKENAIMHTLSKLKGGIHCMTLEEPNFERWV